MKKLIYFIALVTFASLLFISCEEEENPAKEKGTIKLSLTADAPVEDLIVNVFVTLTEIQLLQNDTWVNFEGFQGPQKFNLMELTDGITASLGSLSVDAGKYSKIRFLFNAPEMSTLNESGCSVELTYSTVFLYVPDNSPDAWEAVGAFEVPANGEVEVTASFNIRKSILDYSFNDMYILYPTFRLINNARVGNITGNLTNMPANGNIAIYAYKDGDYNVTEDLVPSEDTKVQFPNSITNSIANPNNCYDLQLLDPMTYDLVVTLVNETGYFEKVLGIVEDVIVESSKTTNKLIDLNSIQ